MLTAVCPWSRVLPKLILLVKRSPEFYGTRRFITVFTPACCLSRFWAIGILSAPSLPIYLRPILILSSRLRLDHPNEINHEYLLTFCWPCTSVYLSQYITNLMRKICFTVSFISCLYMFRAHVLIIRRSKFHYTASGIFTPIGDTRASYTWYQRPCNAILTSWWWAHVLETCRGMKWNLKQILCIKLVKYWDKYEYLVNRELGSLLGIVTTLWAGWHSVRLPAGTRDPSLNLSDRLWVPPSLLFNE